MSWIIADEAPPKESESEAIWDRWGLLSPSSLRNMFRFVRKVKKTYIYILSFIYT